MLARKKRPDPTASKTKVLEILGLTKEARLTAISLLTLEEVEAYSDAAENLVSEKDDAMEMARTLGQRAAYAMTRAPGYRDTYERQTATTAYDVYSVDYEFSHYWHDPKATLKFTPPIPTRTAVNLLKWDLTEHKNYLNELKNTKTELVQSICLDSILQARAQNAAPAPSLAVHAEEVKTHTAETPDEEEVKTDTLVTLDESALVQLHTQPKEAVSLDEDDDTKPIDESTYQEVRIKIHDAQNHLALEALASYAMLLDKYKESERNNSQIQSENRELKLLLEASHQQCENLQRDQQLLQDQLAASREAEQKTASQTDLVKQLEEENQQLRAALAKQSDEATESKAQVIKLSSEDFSKILNTHKAELESTMFQPQDKIYGKLKKLLKEKKGGTISCKDITHYIEKYPKLLYAFEHPEARYEKTLPIILLLQALGSCFQPKMESTPKPAPRD